MFRAKKAQAGLEFLMSYGWAILVLLCVIAAIAYFGVYQPGQMISAKCMLEPGWSCPDFVASESGNNITLNLRQSMAQSVTVTAVSANTTSGEKINCGYSGSVVLPSNTPAKVTLTCTPGQLTGKGGTGNKYRFNLDITFYLSTSGSEFSKALNGDLVIPIET